MGEELRRLGHCWHRQAMSELERKERITIRTLRKWVSSEILVLEAVLNRAACIVAIIVYIGLETADFDMKH